MPDPTGGTNDWKFSGDGIELGLESDEACAKAWLSIAMRTVEVDGHSASRDPKNLTMKFLQPVCTKNFWVYKVR